MGSSCIIGIFKVTMQEWISADGKVELEGSPLHPEYLASTSDENKALIGKAFETNKVEVDPSSVFNDWGSVQRTLPNGDVRKLEIGTYLVIYDSMFIQEVLLPASDGKIVVDADGTTFSFELEFNKLEET